MSEAIVSYEHHEVEVRVRENLKGKHREHCLCYSCKHFNSKDRPNNCVVAYEVYDTFVTPVWECPVFEEK